MTFKQKQEIHLNLELLGIGSSKDLRLRANLLEAARSVKLNLTIKDINSIDKFLKYDISGIPALVKDGQIIFQKIVPTVEELRIILGLLSNSTNLNWRPNPITVPVDLTEESVLLSEVGAYLANELGAPLELLHIHPAVSTSLVEENQDYNKYNLKAKEHLKQLKAILIKELTQINTTVRNGYPAEVLKEISNQQQQGLMVMGISGKKIFLGKIFGNTTSSMIKQAACPVLFMPKAAKFKKFKKVAFAHTFQVEDVNIIHQLISFCQPLDADLDLVNVVDEKGLKYFEETTFLQIPVKSYTKDINLVKIESEDIAKGIKQYIESNQIDLLVMSTVHRSFVEQIFHNSTTSKILSEGTIPLMIFHQ